MIRFIIVATFVFLFLVLSIPLLIAEWIIGKFNMDVKNRSSLAIVNWAFRVCLFLSGVKITVRGEENVPKDTPVLYIGNHRSYFDILITYVRVPRPTGYIAKKEMLHFPCVNRWMKFLSCLFLDRDNVREGLKTILQGIEQIKAGYSVFIMPEGTRNHGANLLPFHEGSCTIAVKSGCPIVPMTINNSAAIFENQFPFIKKAHVIIEYGKPVYPKELPKENQKHLGEYVSNIIMETYNKNKERI